MIKLARIGQALFMFLGFGLASCIKEDRTACPCVLSIEVCGMPTYPVNLALEGAGYSETLQASCDTVITVRVPKSGVNLVAIAGTSLPSGNSVSIPLGYDCPPLYLSNEWIDTQADEASVTVQLHKHFCALSLSFDGPPGWGEPYWANVRGRVDGLSLEGEPQEGDFSCRLDTGNDIRLPRQHPEEELWLDISMPDMVVRSFALGNYMQDAGYDWTAHDLEDLSLKIDLSVTAITISTDYWSVLIPMDVEI